MTPRSEDGWTLTSLVFTLILVVITLAGSLWVMYHMDNNMMPRHQASQPL
jgi:cytochrome o ubiquinol oxidase operon protein cyoD